jgi:hypothetical protein
MPLPVRVEPARLVRAPAINKIISVVCQREEPKGRQSRRFRQHIQGNDVVAEGGIGFEKPRIRGEGRVEPVTALRITP